MTVKEKIILYHGTDHIIEHPFYGYGRLKNDYGRGFYCTGHQELAKEWACKDNRDGYVNEYELDAEGLRIKILDESNILEWIALLMKNRDVDESDGNAVYAKKAIIDQYLPDIRNDDIIIGYRADDSYFDFARGFIENRISIEDLGTFLHLANLGTQTVLVSKKSFTRISFLSAEPVDSHEYFQRSKKRDQEARRAYRERIRQNLSQSYRRGKYVQDILKEIMKKEKEDEPSL